MSILILCGTILSEYNSLNIPDASKWTDSFSCLVCHRIPFIYVCQNSYPTGKKMSPLGDPFTEVGTKGQN